MNLERRPTVLLYRIVDDCSLWAEMPVNQKAVWLPFVIVASRYFAFLLETSATRKLFGYIRDIF